MKTFSQLEGTRVRVNEVAPRDGFQMESRFVPTEEKIRLIDALSELGFAKIEVTSFVSPKAIPALRDAAEVMQGIRRNPDVTYVALIPNEKGAERALACHTDEINLVMSVSETHNLNNMRMTCQQSLDQFRRIMGLLHGTTMKVNSTAATAFGCPFEGAQAPSKVLSVVERYLELGMDSVTLADTIGVADPRQVQELVSQCLDRFPDIHLTLHLHDTRGMGLASVLAGLQAGVRSFDASLGGLGGCPYAPGATGNICTEDTVHMLNAMGLATGIDDQALLAVARRVPDLVGHGVPSHLLKARAERTHT